MTAEGGSLLTASTGVQCTAKGVFGQREKPRAINSEYTGSSVGLRPVLQGHEL